MAISPLMMNDNITSEELETSAKKTLPNKTYEFDFKTGEINNRFVDGKEAIRQAILKALLTPRFEHLIYGFDYGNELQSLIEESVSFEFLEKEAIRLASECIEQDDRIKYADRFFITRNADGLYIRFEVELVDGEIYYEEVRF
jgi:hypothetical protein